MIRFFKELFSTEREIKSKIFLDGKLIYRADKKLDPRLINLSTYRIDGIPFRFDSIVCYSSFESFDYEHITCEYWNFEKKKHILERRQLLMTIEREESFSGSDYSYEVLVDDNGLVSISIHGFKKDVAKCEELSFSDAELFIKGFFACQKQKDSMISVSRRIRAIKSRIRRK